MLRDYTVASLVDKPAEETVTDLLENEEDLADIYDDQIVNDSHITSSKPLFKRQQSTYSVKSEETVGPYCRRPIKKQDSKPKEETEEKIEPDLEKVEEGTVKAQVFKNYFNAIGIPYMAAMILCYFGSHGAGTIFYYCSRIFPTIFLSTRRRS